MFVLIQALLAQGWLWTEPARYRYERRLGGETRTHGPRHLVARVKQTGNEGQIWRRGRCPSLDRTRRSMGSAAMLGSWASLRAPCLRAAVSAGTSVGFRLGALLARGFELRHPNVALVPHVGSLQVDGKTHGYS